MAYPDPAMERVTDGRQTRFATTDDVLRIAERTSGQELGWFFEVYLRQPALPRLIGERTGDALRLRWSLPEGLPDSLAFPMPVDVRVDGALRRVEVSREGVTVPLPRSEADVAVDPMGWLLKDEAGALDLQPK